MTQLTGYIRSFTAHDNGIDIHTDHQMLHLQVNPNLIVDISVAHQFSCCNCKKNVKKLYSQAYCFPCSQKLARCDLCILKPELCHYDQGTCREPAWGEEFCMIPHIVYLSYTSDIKVGITRKNRLHTRWREQGALMGAALFETQNRHEAGVIEHQLKSYYKDQTAWRKMLQTHTLDEQQFEQTFKEASAHIRTLTQKETLTFTPSRTHYLMPSEVKATSLASTKEAYQIQSPIIGIKGHYLLFPQGVVSTRSWLGRYVSYQSLEQNK